MAFRYGVPCSFCPSDPCGDLRGALTVCVEKPRAALTNPDKVAGLMASIEGHEGSYVVRAALWYSNMPTSISALQTTSALNACTAPER